jgi:16S rRNA (guanine966-N2)-methyltransferase
VRIIGGAFGGRRLRAPHGTATRPTSDRVREAVFNILGAPPDKARVLDLYAGAGAMGLEALSRGAESAVFVDRDAQAARVVQENIDSLGVGEHARLYRSDALPALRKLAAAGERFAWVFIDPPYASDEAPRALAALGEPLADLLDDGAVVIVEHDRRHAPDETFGALARADQRRYGDTCVSFFTRSEP